MQNSNMMEIEKKIDQGAINNDSKSLIFPNNDYSNYHMTKPPLPTQTTLEQVEKQLQNYIIYCKQTLVI